EERAQRTNQLAASQMTLSAEDYHDARISRAPHSGLRRNRHCRCVEHFQLPRKHANVTPSSCWLWVPRVRRTSGAWLRAFSPQMYVPDVTGNGQIVQHSTHRMVCINRWPLDSY